MTVACKTCGTPTQYPSANGLCTKCVADAKLAEVHSAFRWDHYTHDSLRDIGRAYYDLALVLLRELPQPDKLLHELHALKRASIDEKLFQVTPEVW